MCNEQATAGAAREGVEPASVQAFVDRVYAWQSEGGGILSEARLALPPGEFDKLRRRCGLTRVDVDWLAAMRAGHITLGLHRAPAAAAAAETADRSDRAHRSDGPEIQPTADSIELNGSVAEVAERIRAAVALKQRREAGSAIYRCRTLFGRETTAQIVEAAMLAPSEAAALVALYTGGGC